MKKTANIQFHAVTSSFIIIIYIKNRFYCRISYFIAFFERSMKIIYMMQPKLDFKNIYFDNYFCVKIWKGGPKYKYMHLGFPYMTEGFPDSTHVISQVHTWYFVASSRAKPCCLPQNIMYVPQWMQRCWKNRPFRRSREPIFNAVLAINVVNFERRIMWLAEWNYNEK